MPVEERETYASRFRALAQSSKFPLYLYPSWAWLTRDNESRTEVLNTLGGFKEALTAGD